MKTNEMSGNKGNEELSAYENLREQTRTYLTMEEALDLCIYTDDINDEPERCLREAAAEEHIRRGGSEYAKVQIDRCFIEVCDQEE
jgi:hypothetical protein